MKQTKKHDIFNLPFTETLSINVLVVLGKHFLPNSNLHKISNINTVNFSYSCIPNVGSIIKSYNKKLINAENKQTKDCNCKKRKNARWKVNVDIYKCVVTATDHPQKVYLGTAEGDFKQQCYSHKKSLRSRKYANQTSFSKCIWKIEVEHNTTQI